MTNRPPYPGTPRWVKVFGIVAIVVVLLVIAMLLIGGEHGPSRHTSSGDRVPTFGVMGDHAPPEGGRG